MDVNGFTALYSLLYRDGKRVVSKNALFFTYCVISDILTAPTQVLTAMA